MKENQNSFISLCPVSSRDKNIIFNLMPLYLHDLSAYTNNLTVDRQGRFVYENLDLYWEREALQPYLIKSAEDIVGFLLLNRPPFAPTGTDFYVNELFILTYYRRKGFARKALKQCFTDNPGNYMVVQMIKNKPAISFWHRLYEEEGIIFEERQDVLQDEPCLLQKFTI
ncbi:GNAT family N-acetyltransferase [Brevibacillus sp. 7WMA2]|uniref:GNAT family N-acetyltransferase n=1 Tax=Brevibacillus TaxID=55080 RepID=UPI0013A72376|nr:MULTISPECIES: GNAT family N-acetyltransferase [Brevibacillus]MCR8995235.1 GNAT family N-acetyltransferase [Brevibacillus laterosporus]QIC04483.1 GNAT family N-acetyltransferase [Brevibacillus sp. 7WMA2]